MVLLALLVLLAHLNFLNGTGLNPPSFRGSSSVAYSAMLKAGNFGGHGKPSEISRKFGGFALFARPAFAASVPTFFLQTEKTQAQKEQILLVQVFLDSASQTINTLSLRISFDPSILQFQDSSFENSYFPNIVERKIEDSVEGKKIFKAGSFTLSPYSGSEGLVTTLKFKAISEGSAEIKILPNSKIHLANGKGTNVFDPLNSQTLKINIGKIPELISPVVLGAETPHRAPRSPTELGERSEKEKDYFPEKAVTDYTKSPQVFWTKILNKFRTPQILPYLLIICLSFIFFSIRLLKRYVFQKKSYDLPYPYY